MSAAAMLVRGPMVVAMRRGDTLEVPPVLPETAPMAVVVDVPFRACRQGSTMSESRRSGEEAEYGT